MERIKSVDTFRLIAIFAVIAIHTRAFGGASEGNIAYKFLFVVINQMARFAVPFFFVISGYFWGVKVRSGSCLISFSLKMTKRILVIFLAWCVVYLLPYNFSAFFEYGILGPVKIDYQHIDNLMQSPVSLLMEGTKPHLWFLVALIFCVGINAIFIRKKWLKSLIVLSLALYIIGVLSKAYANSPFGIYIEFNTRNGPFFGTLFFTSGYFLSGLASNNKWLFYGLILFCLGCLVHFSEIYILWKMYGVPLNQDYVFGTYFMGVGVAMISLSNHPVLQNEFLSQVGKKTLGIYAIQYVFVDLLRPINNYTNTPFWEIGYPMLVFVLSILAVLVISRHQTLRTMVE